MGIVYRAFDLALERKIALKLVAPDVAADEAFRERFHRESRLAASLDHPGIVPVYDAGEAGGQLYIAMRLVEGTDLKRLLAAEGRLEPQRALELLYPVASALDAAHERGVVHRDIKPSNVLMDSRGHCYLADFGLSRRMADEPGSAAHSRSLGTSDYVAPEQIRGERATAQADVYSFGCLLYECLTGEPPFRRRTELETVFAHLEAAPPLVPRLEAVVARALAKEPAERYGSCTELVADAARAMGVQHRRRRRRLALAALSAVGGVVVAGALVLDGGEDVASANARAEQAVAAASRDPQTALRIALEAAGEARTPTTEGALRVALASFPRQRTLRGHADYVSDAVFSPDGRHIVTTSDDGNARIWETQSGRSLHVLQGASGQVPIFSPSGRLLATGGGWTHMIQIWNVETGRRIAAPRGDWTAGFTADGEGAVVIGGGIVRVVSTRTGVTVKTLAARAQADDDDRGVPQLCGRRGPL